MSNLVKQTQLKEVVVDLWNKVKGRTDVAFKEANYNETTQTITFTKIDDSTVDVALTDLVSKSNANVITGETLITDGYILGGIISKLDNQHTNMSSASLPHYFGLKSARVTTNQKLTHITIGIHDSVAVGTQITGIKVGAIKVSDNTISHYVVNDATATVQENKNSELTNCTRAVVVPLDTPFTPTEDSWFCVSCLNAAWGERSTALSSEDACTEGGNPNGIMPNIGSTVTVKRSGYLGKYLLHTDKISLNDLANVANGAVKTVNNQMPDGQGNVTVGIAHIDNLQTELDNRVLLSQIGNQANQIPQIGGDGKLDASIIPELAITRVKTVNTKQEALDLVGDSTEAGLQTGDVVVITGENNAIFMYNGGTNSNFDTDFIELSIGDGTVKMVNGQAPSGTGEVVLTATVSQEVDGDIVLTVGNQNNFATLQCMTDQEVEAIKALFV